MIDTNSPTPESTPSDANESEKDNAAPASEPSEAKTHASDGAEAVKGTDDPAPRPPAAEAETWEDLALDPKLEELILKAGFKKPTTVQAKTIPLALQGLDLLVSSQTGSGKTAAFVLPMVELLRGREGLKGLILAPSREIALQSAAVMKEFGEPLGIRSICLIGGIDLRSDERALATYPQVIIATPGRLCDHIERGNLWLEYLEFLVLDEADRMLDLGFSAQLSRIMLELPPSRQTLLFSATIPPSVDKLAERMLYHPEKVQIGRPSNQPAKVEQKFVHVDPKEKFRALVKILRQEKGTVFVFIGSKLNVTKTFRSLRSAGFYEATQLHSDLRQKDREQALQDFKDGAFRVILATDVIGRGIHVDGVNLVVNYDLPREASDYVHRIGRTGRAGESGKAVSFITPKDARIFKDILKLTGQKDPGEHPEPAPRAAAHSSTDASRPRIAARVPESAPKARTADREPSREAPRTSDRDRAPAPRSGATAGSSRASVRSAAVPSSRSTSGSTSSASPTRMKREPIRAGDRPMAPLDEEPSVPSRDRDAYDSPRSTSRDRDSYDAPRSTSRDRDSYDNPRSTSRDRDSYDSPRSTSRDRDSYDAPRSTSRDRDSYDAPRSTSRDRDSYDAPRSTSRDRDSYDAPRSTSRDRDSHDAPRSTTRDRDLKAAPRSTSRDRDSHDAPRSASRDSARGADRTSKPSSRPTSAPRSSTSTAPKPRGPSRTDTYDTRDRDDPRNVPASRPTGRYVGTRSDRSPAPRRAPSDRDVAPNTADRAGREDRTSRDALTTTNETSGEPARKRKRRGGRGRRGGAGRASGTEGDSNPAADSKSTSTSDFED